MLIGIRVLLLLAICSCCYAISCSLGPFSSAACVGSCQLQNCGTGSCDDDKICHCSRCIDGPPWHLNINVNADVTRRKKALQASRNMTINEDIGKFQLCGTGSGDYMNRTFVFSVTTVAGTANENVDYNPNALPTLMFFTEDADSMQCVEITIHNDDEVENGEKFSIIITRPIIEDNVYNITMSIGDTVEKGHSFTLDMNIVDDNDTNSAGSATASMLLCIIILIATIGMLL